MRKAVVVGIVLLMASVSLGFVGKEVKLTGYLIDNACSARASGEGGAEKVKAHSTKCAQMPNCAKSGYAIYAEGKLYKLDDAGNAKAAEILKNTKTERGLQVSVQGDLDGETLRVKSIEEKPAT
jgi:hypothetical protein